MLIAQISDLHISQKGKKTLGIAPMSENLKQCVSHINHLPSRPDLVLVTGDISNSGKYEELEHAKLLLDNLAIPYYVIPGNHDNRTDLLTLFGNNSCQVNDDQLIHYRINNDDIQLDDIQLIALDTSMAKKPGGEFTHSSGQWLENELKKSNNKPVILFMHHPPVNMGIAETDIEGFIGKERLANIVQKHDNIEAILCGHIHLSAHTRWHGTIVSTAPSIGMRLCIDFTLQEESKFQLSEPQYQLHYWTKEKNLISFDINVNETQKTYSFHPDN